MMQGMHNAENESLSIVASIITRRDAIPALIKGG